MTDVKAQIEALNKNGEVRAWARGPWQIGELIKLLMEWQKADPNRVIHINAIHRAHPPRADLAPTGNAALVADKAWRDYAESQHFKENLIEQVSDVLTAALATPAAVTPTEDVRALADRHENRDRNKIINSCSTDLDRIINHHDPEIGNLNNDVWDRLDKMAVEIEALAKHKGGGE